MTSPRATELSAYRERLSPAWWIWAMAPGLAAGLALTVARISSVGAVVTFLAGSAVLLVLLVRSTPTLSVGRQDGGRPALRAGRAHIALELTGEVTVLDAAAMRQAHGPGLDVRAYLCLRGWIATGVRVALIDPNDPTPYWLLSSRRPDELAAAVEETRRRREP